jgi:phage terminase large subunit
LESLRQYRREYDENKRTFKPTPLHDWTSHDADAFRYLAVGMEPDAAVPPDIPRYSGRKRRWQDNDTSSDSGWAA